MKNILKVNPNERVDISDFNHAVKDTPENNFSELGNQFLCNPGVYEKSVLTGFEMTNPAGNQIQITRGRAILHQRIAGTIIKSLLTTSGDTSKTVDISAYPNNTYGIFIRFEAPPGSPDGRIFWNPAGTGSEYTQTIETRYVANWSVRIEVSNPGEEWLQIGTVVKPGMAITDQRDLYFEGVVSANYPSGWSTEGGGLATDRSTDRSGYGIGDLHTFVAAIKQCVEDLKGRGLRRWFAKGIGGMNIGFDDDPVEGKLALGDSDYYLQLVGSTLPSIVFDSGANYKYHRTNKQHSWNSSSATILTLSETALFPDSLALGTTLYHWTNFYVDSTNTYGSRYLSCCSDDSAPSFSNQVVDNKNTINGSLLYSGGSSNAHLTRKKEVYNQTIGALPFTAKKQQLIEGLQALTLVNHQTDEGDTLANSMNIGTGAAIVGGQDSLIQGGGPGAVQLTDLWDSTSSGGLTTEAKTYLASATNGYENCLWMYVWLRSDGSFWLEPFGPEPNGDYVWTEDYGRYSPRTVSGLPQTGFNKIDYLLVDVCWLVYGKAKTSGVLSDIVNFSGGIYMGNGYRHLERANYSDGATIVPEVYNTTSGFSTPLSLYLKNVDTVSREKRSPGIPVVSRKARLAIIGNANLAASSWLKFYVGFPSTSNVNADLMVPGIAFSNRAANYSFIETNSTGGALDYPISAIIDADVDHEINGTTNLYDSKVVLSYEDFGTVTLSLNVQVLGFYWDRAERDVLTYSMP